MEHGKQTINSWENIQQGKEVTVMRVVFCALLPLRVRLCYFFTMWEEANNKGTSVTFI